MKVAAITPINTPNYGPVLQAFALQEAVKSLGHEYAVLNYYNKEQELKFSFWGSTSYMDWKYKIAKKVLFPIRKYQLCQILSFQNSYINLSKRIKKRSELDDVRKQYDIFITGSDQVWNNQEINHFDDAYFLAFARDKTKIAYAASFGKTYPMLTADDIEFYKNNMPYVDHISVREKTGAEIVNKICGRNTVQVCDPVFLLTKEDWTKYCQAPKQHGYILVYLVGDGINFDINKQIVERAKKAAKQHGKKVIVVGIGLASVLYGAHKTPTVQKWLGLIDHADLLMTNSFHGTAFAVILETPFYSFVRGSADNRMNTRLYDLLSYLGLGDRLHDMQSSVQENLLRIDFEKCRGKISEFRQHSINFISSAIDN